MESTQDQMNVSIPPERPPHGFVATALERWNAITAFPSYLSSRCVSEIDSFCR